MKKFTVKFGIALLVIEFVLVLLVVTGNATDYIYIISNRNVYVDVSCENPGESPVIVDCQDKNNIDPIACIIISDVVKKNEAARRLHYTK